eukprot:s4693_g5.t1
MFMEGAEDRCWVRAFAALEQALTPTNVAFPWSDSAFVLWKGLFKMEGLGAAWLCGGLCGLPSWHRPSWCCGVWAFLWELCCAGKLAAILGGPPCRTTSHLRERRPGPLPLPGRDHVRFALEGLSKWDLHRVHSDTALLMKQLGLYLKAEERRFVLESPQNPMNYLGFERAAVLPSFWNFAELQGMVGVGGLKMISLDQSETGHTRQKPMTLMENLPGLDQLDELRSSRRRADPLLEGLQASMDPSKDWAAWSPGVLRPSKRRCWFICSIERGFQDLITKRNNMWNKEDETNQDGEEWQPMRPKRKRGPEVIQVPLGDATIDCLMQGQRPTKSDLVVPLEEDQLKPIFLLLQEEKNQESLKQRKCYKKSKAKEPQFPAENENAKE